MNGKEKVTIPSPSTSWTTPDAYVTALARKRSYRRAREDRTRSQPVAPRAWLSTVPFMALIAVLGVMAIATMIVAFPGRQPAPRAKTSVPHEQGVAPPGWFQEAQKQFHK